LLIADRINEEITNNSALVIENTKTDSTENLTTSKEEKQTINHDNGKNIPASSNEEIESIDKSIF